MPVAQTLTSAIHATFNSSGLITTIAGGLWTGEVPEGTSPPYAWLDIDYMNIEPQMKDAQWEAGRFRVSIFGIGAQQAENCAQAFRDIFDYKVLGFNPGTQSASVQLMPRQYRLRCENLRFQNSQLMFRATLVYHILLTRYRDNS